ncbi:DUF2505 domain-containing protein [Nocardioides yefusunii]|uniref:DUF2505 domain-containing protein n=1 Tax=Nocardioides yefusunii TaxID=2500546 RepID=A0ABW1QXK9_9ACTN|nr:DUF2505 domain-containing protein [Nocardioides yefusunii]
MTKRITQQLTYDAPLADVAAMLREETFRDAVCARQRVLNHTVTVHADGDAADVQITREQKVEGIPSFATKFVGESITITTRENWADLTTGTYDVGIPDKPGHISGAVSLTEVDGKTVETVDLKIQVSVPLVGGKLEAIVADLLEAALRTEHEVGVKHLAR